MQPSYKEVKSGELNLIKRIHSTFDLNFLYQKKQYRDIFSEICHKSTLHQKPAHPKIYALISTPHQPSAIPAMPRPSAQHVVFSECVVHTAWLAGVSNSLGPERVVLPTMVTMVEGVAAEPTHLTNMCKSTWNIFPQIRVT